MASPWHRIQRLALTAALALSAGCNAPLPTTASSVGLPIPPGLGRPGPLHATDSQPAGGRYLAPGQTHIDLTPMRVIHIAFENSPRIRSAYLKYEAEKARYDYIVADWTSTTPGLSLGPRWQHDRDISDASSTHQYQRLDGFVERNFLDTSRLRAFASLINEDDDDSHGFHPAAGGLLHYPLWGSREALQRASDQIFQQNRVNDAELEYIKEVREQLSALTATFFAVLGIHERVQCRRQQVDDLTGLLERVRAAGRTADEQPLQAAITTAVTELRSQQSNFAIEMAWMTSTMGLPHNLEVGLIAEPFDPFGKTPPDELLALSVQVDPEIAALKNAIKDSQAQLALARKGRLDVSINLGGQADAAGSGGWGGRTEYRADALLAVSFIDRRISDSLAREASSNIARYQNAIQRRRNEVYVEAAEPLIKLQVLARNIPDQEQTVARYRRDYERAVEDYFDGRMNIDGLVRRRQDLIEQELTLSFSKSEQGGRMASLAAATGKYFELLQRPPEPLPAAATRPGPATARYSAAAAASAPASRPYPNTLQEVRP